MDTECKRGAGSQCGNTLFDWNLDLCSNHISSRNICTYNNIPYLLQLIQYSGMRLAHTL